MACLVLWIALIASTLLHIANCQRIHQLKFVGDLNPEMVNRHAIHIKLNKHNYNGKPPSLAHSATALLGSEFLAVIHPPMERSRFNPLGSISPKCTDDYNCKLEKYRVREHLGFTLDLSLVYWPLPGINVNELKPDDNGHMPPTKGVTGTVHLEVVTDGDKNGKKALEEMIILLKDILQVKEPKEAIIKVVGDEPNKDEYSKHNDQIDHVDANGMSESSSEEL